MSHSKQKVPVKVKNRSGFDLSFENILSLNVGTLVPVLVEPVNPNETFSLGSVSSIQFPPFATDFYGRVDLHLDAFFVPNRVIYGGWRFLVESLGAQNEEVLSNFRDVSLPSYQIDLTKYGPGTLADYLGVKGSSRTGIQYLEVKNSLPFLAYHKIWEDWYRNKSVQNPAFAPDFDSFGLDSAGTAPFSSGTINYDVIYSDLIGNSILNDGTLLGSLRQRNWDSDYFTDARLEPSPFTSVAYDFEVEDDMTGEISVQGNHIQNLLGFTQFLQRNNIGGADYANVLKNNYGAKNHGYFNNKSVHLGTKIINCYNRTADITTGTSTANPFSVDSGLGQSSFLRGEGSGSLINEFTSDEHGFIFVMASIVPRALYSFGQRRYLSYSKLSDFPNPLLEGIGDQEIYMDEVDGSGSKLAFAYTQRFAETKCHEDEVHGLLRSGESLSAFALQRPIAGDFDSNFLEIPITALDDLRAVDVAVSDYGAILDVYFSFKKVSPFSEYAIPSLCVSSDDTHTEYVDLNGSNL